jgi:hypothetical protein
MNHRDKLRGRKKILPKVTIDSTLLSRCPGTRQEEYEKGLVYLGDKKDYYIMKSNLYYYVLCFMIMSCQG